MNRGDGHGRPASILLVDDEPDVLGSLNLILSIEGYEVMSAHNGHSALDQVARRRPELVVTDFMMPWMNGREFLMRLHASEFGRGIPSIMMSGVNPGEPVLWTAFLFKPMDISELLRTIERLLASTPSPR